MNDDGIFILPNVALGSKDLFGNATGDVFADNPFGYISKHGLNGLFLIKIVKKNAIEYFWLDITKFNIAFWQVKRDEHTFIFNTGIGNKLILSPLDD